MKTLTIKFLLGSLVFVTFISWFMGYVTYTVLPNSTPSVELHLHSNEDTSHMNLNINSITTNIGVVIPSHYNKNTLNYLKRVLNSILFVPTKLTPTNTHVYFPSEIVISMSISTNNTNDQSTIMQNVNNIKTKYQTLFGKYLHKLEIYFHLGKRLNSAQNRNVGISKLDPHVTKYISFFDIDDIMHPQRIGIMYKILNHNTEKIDLLFHSYINHIGCKNTNLTSYASVSVDEDCINVHNDNNIDQLYQLYYGLFENYQIPFLNNHEFTLLEQPILKGHGYKYYNKYDREMGGYADYYQSSKCHAHSHYDCCLDCNLHKLKNSCLLPKNKTRCINSTYMEFSIYNNLYYSQSILSKEYNYPFMSLINYSDFVYKRCTSKQYTVIDKLTHKDCVFKTLSYTLEKGFHKYRLTRIANGWVTVKYDIANQIRYNESDAFSTAGEDVTFNLNSYFKGYKIFHLLNYLGIYCRNFNTTKFKNSKYNLKIH